MFTAASRPAVVQVNLMTSINITQEARTSIAVITSGSISSTSPTIIAAAVNSDKPITVLSFRRTG
ncbi:hypothetical protein D3C71_2140070 [compost metagenome]